MDATTNIVIANNQIAANRMEEIFNRNDVKGSIAKLAKLGSGVFKKITEGIHDMSRMTDDQIRAEVSRTFKEAKEKLQKELSVINSIPSYRDSQTVKDVEEGIKVFALIEKNILDLKDMNVVQKGLLMFWTGVKYIAGLIVRSCIAAAKFVIEYGIKIIAIGLDFVFRIIQKTVKFFKTIVRIAAAVRVGIDGTETPEIIDVEASEYY